MILTIPHSGQSNTANIKTIGGFSVCGDAEIVGTAERLLGSVQVLVDSGKYMPLDICQTYKIFTD